ncbi:hypothetical protein DAPPUDRAFT_105672 [Daphnia pulex]|uniref:Uncharacterized protein n=1 Tax=Daphnia pulex TaxID=6669 RepID=E9GRF5_DAPPU|nr:hypothetical protein DAPPUDRAFT_105672 [Daphnia pulex]|eukprot:EFX77997.1 hypothetical protein DAPPUDRAFT_105672 [Daphnia pulex]
MEHAQTCPTPDVVAVMTQSLMTQQPASPPDVYSIAVMTKSSSKMIKLQESEYHITASATRCLAVMTKFSSKVLGRFPTIKSITDRSCYRKANSKTIRLYARLTSTKIPRI